MNMENINLNELRDRVYQNAVAHGWHEEEYSREHYMCLVITELCEAVQADRDGHYAAPDREYHEKLLERGIDPVDAFERFIKGTVEDELADVIIRLLDYAGVKGMDMSLYDWHRELIEGQMAVYEKGSFTESVFFIISRVLKERPKNSLIEVFAFARTRGIDNLFWYVEQKMKYNETRPYRHGGKKY